MLEPDLAALFQKLLKILIGAVPVVLVTQNGLYESRVRGGEAPAGHCLQRFDILESAQTAGDIPSRQGLAFQSRDDTNHVEDSSGLCRMRRDSGDFELSFFEPESLESEEHTSELQSHSDLVCRLLLEKKNITKITLHEQVG